MCGRGTRVWGRHRRMEDEETALSSGGGEASQGGPAECCASGMTM
jgi:hypothetical protein